jgi:hypothetical protein
MNHKLRSEYLFVVSFVFFSVEVSPEPNFYFMRKKVKIFVTKKTLNSKKVFNINNYGVISVKKL